MKRIFTILAVVLSFVFFLPFRDNTHGQSTPIYAPNNAVLVLNPCASAGVWSITYTPLACNNSTDDSVAMQNLLNTVNASAIPVELDWPGKTIKLTKQIIIANANAANIKWRGQPGVTVFNFTAEDTHGSGFMVENSTNNIDIEGITTKGATFTSLRVLYTTGGFTLNNSTITNGGQGSGDAGVPPAGLYIQGSNHLKVTANTFTANGPQSGATSCTDKNSNPVICPAGYTVVTGFQSFPGNLVQSLTYDLTFRDNRIFGNNSQFPFAGFNLNQSHVVGNFCDQNNAFLNDTTPDAETPQGYCYLSYGADHVNSSTGNWVSTARSGNVVTETLTAGQTVPYVVGQWIMIVSSALGQTNATQFSGAFQIASVTGSGGATPQFTWNQFGANDSLLASPDVVNANVANSFQGNYAQNSAGSSIYFEGTIDSNAIGNRLFNGAQMMDSLSIPIGGIVCNGCARDSFTGNEINTMVSINPNQIGGQSYLAEGISVNDGFDMTVGGNTITDYSHAGVNVATVADGVAIDHNTIDGASVGLYGVFVPASFAYQRVVVTSNTIKLVSNTGISFGAAVAGGFGFGCIVANNSIEGNTLSAVTIFGIFLSGAQQMQIADNFILGTSNANGSGRTLGTGIELTGGGTRDVISGNTIELTSNSVFAAIDANTSDDWYGNVIYNLNNVFDGHSSINLRVHDNRFDTTTTAETFGAWPASAERWNNKLTTTGLQRGTGTLVAGTATISTIEIQTADIVRITRMAAGGTLGFLSYGTITNGTSFVVTSSNAADTSAFQWEILH